MGFPVIPSDLLVQADLNKYLERHPSSHQRAYVLFLARLGGIKGPYIVKGEDYLWTHVETTKDLVHIFFLLNGQSGHVTEDVNLFPSDTLITQFRILL